MRHRFRSSKPVFKPLIEGLEDRTVPAGQPLVAPPEITSDPNTHILTTTLVATSGSVVIDPISYDGFDAVGGNLVGNFDTYQVQGTTRGLFPGPTLHAQPGDTIDLTLVNNLDASGPPSAFGPTNLHTHGLHVSQLGNSDNVFLEQQPGESNHYHIEIPADHPQGLYWYHPHRHEFTTSQVWSGMSGLLIIGDPDGGATELAGLTDQVMGIRSFQTVTDATGTNMVDVKQQNVTMAQYAVNGQVNPTIDISAGETQVWNIANIGNIDFLSLVVQDTTTGQNLPLYVVAEDGNPLTEPHQVDVVDLAPGRRASFMVQIPAGTAAGSNFELKSLPYFQGFTQWPLGSPTTAVTLATAVVNSTPKTPFVIPTQLTPPNNLFHDLSNETVAEHRSLEFNQGPNAAGMFVFTINGETFPNPPLIQARLNTVEEWTLTNVTKDVHPFHIHQNGFQIMSVNGVAMNPDGTPITVTANTDANGVPTQETYVGGGLTDVIDIPAMDPVTGNPGTVVIRMKFEDFIGHYVYHCHVLGHEDLGMMGIVSVVPENPTYAVGQNPGLPAQVSVFDPITNLKIAQFFPFPSMGTGGVNATVGDVNGDGVYDIIASRQGKTRVRVIDGTKLNQIDANGVISASALLGDFFGFNKTRAGGANISAGDMNGDGLADIIVGGNQGNSRVRIVDATKLGQVNDNREILPAALLSDFRVFDPLFTGGTSVATADTNGDGRIDLVAGSGAGQRAQVAVINGAMLDDVDSTGRISSAALLSTLLPFDSTYTLGVNVATGNTKGFGFNDVIVAAAFGQPPKVEVYSDPGHSAVMGDTQLVKTDEFTAYRPTDLTGLVPTSFFDPVNDILLITPSTGDTNAPLTFDLHKQPPGAGAMGH